MKIAKLLCSCALALSVISCATSATKPAVSDNNNSGFLGSDYSMLKPVSGNNDNLSVYRYVSPSFNRNSYRGVIINPVTIYHPNTDQNESALANARDSLTSYLFSMASKQVNIATKPGPGIAELSVAITGAEVDGDGFKPRNLIPISALIKVASMGIGVDNKQAVLLIEAKLVDSQTKELLGQSVTRISSEKFRDSSSTQSQFEADVQTWVKQSVSTAAGYRDSVN